MIFKDSSSYTEFNGSWIEGNFSDGTLIYKNEDSFKGSFLDGRKYKGTLTFASGGDLLESNETRVQYLAKMIENKEAVNSDLVWKEFKGVWHDETNSEGTLLYESGSKYVGQLKCNKRHGKGIYTYPS